MPTLNQVRTKANNKLTTFWQALQTRQDAYFAKHGKYFQLLVGSELTLDGADTTFSVVSPSDEAHTIDIDYAWSDTVPFQIEVHEWTGSQPGYRGIVTINHEGTLYRRERTNTGEDTGWNTYTPPTSPVTT
jgi:hypothetical protein